MFQNCDRIVLSDKTDVPVQSTSVFTAKDVEASDIIKLMQEANIRDKNEFNETVELSAETMTCGNKTGTNFIQCLFVKSGLEYVSISATATTVRNYLIRIGIEVNCPTCNNTVSYTVRNLNCTRNPNFPHDATCTFER